MLASCLASLRVSLILTIQPFPRFAIFASYFFAPGAAALALPPFFLTVLALPNAAFFFLFDFAISIKC